MRIGWLFLCICIAMPTSLSAALLSESTETEEDKGFFERFRRDCSSDIQSKTVRDGIFLGFGLAVAIPITLAALPAIAAICIVVSYVCVIFSDLLDGFNSCQN